MLSLAGINHITVTDGLALARLSHGPQQKVSCWGDPVVCDLIVGDVKPADTGGQMLRARVTKRSRVTQSEMMDGM